MVVYLGVSALLAVSLHVCRECGRLEAMSLLAATAATAAVPIASQKSHLHPRHPPVGDESLCKSQVYTRC